MKNSLEGLKLYTSYEKHNIILFKNHLPINEGFSSVLAISVSSRFKFRHSDSRKFRL